MRQSVSSGSSGFLCRVVVTSVLGASMAEVKHFYYHPQKKDILTKITLEQKLHP